VDVTDPPSSRQVRSTAPSLLAFFSLTYAVSWICFIASAALPGGTDSSPSGLTTLGGVVLLLGVFGPALVAVALTMRTDGLAGTKRLLHRTVEWPAGARWFVFAVSYIGAIKLVAAVLHRFAIGAWPAFGQQSVFIMLAATAISTPVQAGEEIGWRGYALPRLANYFGLSWASIVLGIIWACWHLPFFFISSTDMVGQSFPAYLLSVTAVSVAMAWLYWRTNGSLLLTMLLHAAVNNTKDIVPSAESAPASPLWMNASLVAWLTVVLLWMCAVYFLVRMRHADLSALTDARRIS
jgi:membrane protease YdiL (CAAX protease family)